MHPRTVEEHDEALIEDSAGVFLRCLDQAVPPRTATRIGPENELRHHNAVPRQGADMFLKSERLQTVPCSEHMRQVVFKLRSQCTGLLLDVIAVLCKTTSETCFHIPGTPPERCISKDAATIMV